MKKQSSLRCTYGLEWRSRSPDWQWPYWTFIFAVNLILFASKSKSLAWAYDFYAMHKSTVMPSLNIIVQVKHLSSLRCNCDQEGRSTSLDWEKIIYLSSDYLHSKLDGHCLNSLWNNWTFTIFMIKLIMPLNEGNIINTWCILMSEAVTVTSIVSEESLERDTHTHIDGHTHTHTDFCHIYLKLFQMS